ncbi:VENN motif pre-toxin domain-containing protein [Erwinia rhapontici]|uniref:VENN motif pre-toxin domain-containing protein n=1 Tax=Erwinia rhapontici TaxID=55212 RepID=UPI003BA054E2
MGNISQEDRDQAQKDWVKAHPGQTPDENAINGQVYQNFYDQAFNATGLGTGGAVQQGIQAATAVVQGLAGGDIAAAIANGSAPYLAEAIGHRMGIDNNPEAKAVAHAIVGAALAAAQGQNAAAGATGAALGEITAGILKDQLYGKDAKIADLTETQKQTLSALATLSSGLAGGLAGDSTESAVYAAQAGKTTAENNSLSGDQAREAVKQSAEYLKDQVRDKLGENIASQLANGLINFASETGDMAMLGGDTAFDLMAALATCATGDGYCSQAKSDLAKKDSAAASILNSIIGGDAWEGIKSSAIKAANDDQIALENVAGTLTSILVPAKTIFSGNPAAKVVVKNAEPKGGPVETGMFWMK